MISRRAVALGGAALIGTSGRGYAQQKNPPAPAASASRKPKLPPGRDPGGVAVAVIGAGVDYTSPKIAGRLARDGEGDLIGWDFVDNDNRPFAQRSQLIQSSAQSQSQAQSPLSTLAAHGLVNDSRHTRLIPVRCPDSAVDALTSAFAFVVRSPARIVVLAFESMPASSVALLSALPERARPLLVVMPASSLSVGAGNWAPIANLLLAAATASDPAMSSDIRLPSGIDLIDDDFRGREAVLMDTAVAVQAATSASLILAKAPALDGIALKREVLATFAATDKPR